MASTTSITSTEFELLLAELRELRMTVSELTGTTDMIKEEVAGISFRLERLKVDKLFISQLEIEGLEIKIGGNKNDCNNK